MEYRDLYDAKRNLTEKTIQKGEDIPEDYFILIVVVFIQNHKGEFLMQKRSERKGGKWATTGGHPKAGETSLEGIQTEVQEELGIHLENPICFKQVTKNQRHCDIYYAIQDVDLNDLKLQEDEVADAKWMSEKEIKTLIKEKKFHKAHGKMFLDYLEYRGNMQ